MRRLTYLQQRFVEFYTSTDGNGVEAARLAGYNGSAPTLRSIASQLTRKPHVATELARARDKQIASQRLTLDWWKREVYDGYTRCVEAGDRGTAARYLELAGKHLGALDSQAPVSPQTAQLIELLRSNAQVTVTQSVSLSKSNLTPPAYSLSGTAE